VNIMRFDAYGWLDQADRQPTLNFYAGNLPPEIIVMHYTASYEAAPAISTFLNQTANASAHFVVDIDGRITQMVSVRDDAWHSGGSEYKGRAEVNRFSVGIEIVNPGYHFKTADGGYENWKHEAVPKKRLAPFGGMIEAYDPWVGSAKMHWAQFPESQLAAVQQLTRTLLSTYTSIIDIVGHRDIDVVRKRKVDPGPAFPMKRFTALLTKRPTPAVPKPVDYLVKSELGYVNVRTKPSITADKVEWSPLVNGERVQQIETRAEWFRVRRWRAGKVSEGWIMARYLTPA
jgi:N-acetylmuramoyl-L-alanine amidase